MSRPLLGPLLFMPILFAVVALVPSLFDRDDAVPAASPLFSRVTRKETRPPAGDQPRLREGEVQGDREAGPDIEEPERVGMTYNP